MRLCSPIVNEQFFGQDICQLVTRSSRQTTAGTVLAMIAEVVFSLILVVGNCEPMFPEGASAILQSMSSKTPTTPDDKPNVDLLIRRGSDVLKDGLLEEVVEQDLAKAGLF